jgi:multiple sugar transport system permease protein
MNEPSAHNKLHNLRVSKKVREGVNSLLLTGLGVVMVAIFLMPLLYGVVTSLKTDNQITTLGAPWWPATARTFSHDGQTYEIFKVVECDADGAPIAWGTNPENLNVPDCFWGGRTYDWGLVVRQREYAEFLDPEEPEAGLIRWEGRWRTLERDWVFDAQWANYVKAWNTINFPRLLGNTLVYALLTTFAVVGSSSLVAYGFARFPLPRKNLLFMIVMATIILPGAVTLIPTYAVFNRIGWVGTWLPLIVPAFFANGYNIFLLRQFFMSIPREIEEAATIDGAGPIRIFISIILPQAVPALVAASMFHFFFAWNNFFEPLIYLAGNPEKYPITVGLTAFNNLYSQQTNLIQAASLVSAVVPLLIFLLAQRVFLQGIVFTGVDK